MKIEDLFKQHIQIRQSTTEKILAKHKFDSLILNAGAPMVYFADNMEAPYRHTPHFAHWVPGKGPHHVLVIEPAKKPKLKYFYPLDFWYEHHDIKKEFWTAEFDIEIFHDLPKLHASVKGGKNTCLIGPEFDGLDSSIARNPSGVLYNLDWERGYKTDYEVHCMKEANRIGAKGHKAALDCFMKGGSEREAYFAYLTGSNQLGSELPYEAIIAYNEKAAILHYHNMRDFKPGDVMLMDCGGRYLHYNSDITRTYIRDANASPAHKLFAQVIKKTEELQAALVKGVKPGMKYSDLHLQSEIAVAQALIDLEIIMKTTAEKAAEDGLSRVFYPHGVGHLLGIQTHDVGGKQGDADNKSQAPQSDNKYLRNLRLIEERNVFTVEPGVYFIPILLEGARHGKFAANINWKLVDLLTPLGGVRIEDDILCTKNGAQNLTREFLP